MSGAEGAGQLPRAIVVGTGAGGAAAARELQGAWQVTVLEAGPPFRRLKLSLRAMERLRNTRLLLDPRMIGSIFRAMRVQRMGGGMYMIRGNATGGTTTLATGNALRLDQPLRALGIDLDREFRELAAEIPASTGHTRWWSDATRKLFDICARMGLEPRPTPKMTDYAACRNCGRCIFGCPYGAKWDSRRLLAQAEGAGTKVVTGARVTSLVIRDGKATGVRVRRGLHTVFMPADLVVLCAGGIGTPAILERSGIPCDRRLFVDPVLCVSAPWPGAVQRKDTPMPFVVQRQGYIVSPYFDHLSFLFDRRWRRPGDSILSLMIKLSDSEEGSVDGRARISKPLTPQDSARLKEAEDLCRDILVRMGAKRESIFLGTLNAGHPGGMLPLTAKDARSLHPARLPENVYVADATLFPESLGNPPILTIAALAMAVARAAKAARAAATLPTGGCCR